ncbi:MAG: ComF family protein [Gammaproteobacteria bacterium]
MPCAAAAAVAGWLRARSPSLPWWTRAGHVLLPPRCVLCGGEGDLGAVDLCGFCLASLPFDDAATHGAAPVGRATFAPFLYEDPVGSGLRALKFRGDPRPACVFGALLAASVGIVAGDAADGMAATRVLALVPVPLHRRRHAERGFNQAEAIARHAGRWLGLPVRTDWLQRARATLPQTALRGAERRRNLVDAFRATPALRAALSAQRAGASADVSASASAVPRSPERVVLIDDVLTTGATVAAARAALVEAGVPAVQVWTVARARPRRDADRAADQAARSA